MLSMVEYVHFRMKQYKNKNIAIDFTMGKGNDTYYLSHLCHKVYAFDIQEEALTLTKEKLDKDNVVLINDGHQNFDKYITNYDIGVFNLGYLPLYDHNITTTLKTTKEAIIKAINYINQVLFIVCYIGHSEGEKEAFWIEEYVSSLDNKKYNVSTYKMLNKNKSPYVIEIERGCNEIT